MFWMEAVPALAFLAGVLLIPESPRFLVAHGRRDAARQIFARIGGNAEALVRQVEQSLRGEHRPRLSDLIERGTANLADADATLSALSGVRTGTVFSLGLVLKQRNFPVPDSRLPPLHLMACDGGAYLAGAKPEDAFYVKVGLGATMTAQDILEGRMIVEIGLAVVRPAEFIVLRFSHKMQTS